MIIWFSILIPIITILFVYIFAKQEIVWWEPLTLMVICSVMVLISKLLIDYSSYTTKEYWGSFVVRIDYYEDWDEWIEATCSTTCCCDKDGNNCQTTYYDCSYRRYHPKEWYMTDNIGQKLSISEAEYNYIKTRKFGGEFFTELNRDYYRQDGDEYSCTWKRDSASSVPITTIHTYKNKIKSSDYSVFNFKKVDTSEVRHYGLIDYPNVGFANSMHAVLGDNSPDAQYADLKLQYYNGLVGPTKESRIFLLVFKDKPIMSGLNQKSYWVGANMNEFVVCVGLDSKTREIMWCLPFSWTTNEKLKIEVRDYITNNPKLKLHEIADYIGISVKNEFKRRDFKEFDYLKAEPSTASIVGAYIFIIILTAAVSFWMITNDERSENSEERLTFKDFHNQQLSKFINRFKNK